MKKTWKSNNKMLNEKFNKELNLIKNEVQVRT